MMRLESPLDEDCIDFGLPGDACERPCFSEVP